MSFKNSWILHLVLITALIIFLSACAFEHPNKVNIVTNDKGTKLQVDGSDFFVFGMNWDYHPIGHNYMFNLWEKPEDIIIKALETEMGLLKEMGVNAIRLYTGIPPKWVKYIYEQYGIFTVLTHSFGRYGVFIDGVEVKPTDYSDPVVREILITEVKVLAREFKDTPGLLMYLLGNENNYGLFWEGAETENIPQGETLYSVRARQMYSLFNLGIKEIRAIDSNHPVAICNGDLQFIDVIAEEIKEPYIFSTNVYRGISFLDLFSKVKEKLNTPLMLTEFGADAFNAAEAKEDQKMQAKYMVANWREIYEQAYGNGLFANTVGGLTFQWSDGWWKHLQHSNLNIHDSTASWANDSYAEDYVEGENNMNEEWFGVCAKGPIDEQGLFQLYPRQAYYSLQQVFKLNPLEQNVDQDKIQNHFNKISMELKAVDQN